MTGYWAKKNFSYVTGALRYKDLAYLSLVDDKLVGQKVTHSYVKEWDAGVWRGEADMDVEWDTVAATIAKLPIEQGLIFQVGYRGRLSRDRGRLGTGIGLADARAVARSHGGDVTIQSHPASPDRREDDYTAPFLTTATIILQVYR